jgi:hypothetical protein
MRLARSEVAKDAELQKVVQGSLAANAGALQQLVGVTYDGAQADEFKQLWQGYSDELAAYADAAAAGNGTGAQEARAALLAHCDDWGAWLADARVQVNRLWAHFLGKGFVNPVGDMHEGNPPDAPLLPPAIDRIQTLFDRLDAHGLTWRVYCDPPSRYSLTGLIHAPRLRDRFATNFFSTDQFFADAENGELPTYALIEPQIIQALYHAAMAGVSGSSRGPKRSATEAK